MNAQTKLRKKTEKGLHICVGLDTDINKIPVHLRESKNSLLEFNKAIINATANEAVSYKINFAFYESLGIPGMQTLEETISCIPSDVLIIADAKRGDIGNTSKMYAQSVFDYFKCDSVTLHPYMGYESVEPFLEYEDKISFILGLTSNSSAKDFEKQKLESGEFLYQKVISKTSEWNTRNNCGLVFGATNLEELQNNISSFEDMPILLPGVGAQGGSLEDVVATFESNSKSNFLINVSRALIYCDGSENFEQIVKKTITDYNITIKSLLA